MSIVNTSRVFYVAPDGDRASSNADSLERAAKGLNVAAFELDGLPPLAEVDARCLLVEHDPPTTDGIDVVRRVREVRPGLPVIVLMAEVARETVTEALDAGATRCLPQPATGVEQEVLLTKVRSVVDRHADRRERSEAVLSTLDAVEVGVVLSAADVGVYAVNDHFCRQFDIPGCSAVVGLSPEAVADEVEPSLDGSEPFRNRIATLTDRSAPTHREELKLSDGRVFELSYLPMNGSAGETMWLYEDVTDQYERRRQLSQYETAVEASGDPVYVLDDHGRFEFVNEALAELTGRDRTALAGRHVSTIMPDRDVQRGESVIRSLLNSGTDHKEKFEMEVIAADGSTILCENHVGLVHTGDRLEGTVGMLRDISERKQREEAVERERDRLAAAFDAAPSPFVHARTDDGELVVERVNSAFEDVFGYDQSDLTGATLGDRIVPEAADDEGATSKSGTREVVRETADGERRTFLLGSAPVTSSGDETEVIRTYTDITDHKRRVRRLEQIRKNVSDVIWISDPDKDEMEFVSDSYEAVWGRPPESLKRDPTSFVEAVHEEDRDRVASEIESQSECPDEYDETYRIIRPDGNIRWVRDRASGIYEDDELERIIGVASDITDRKRRQEELERERAFIKQSLDTLEDIFYVIGTDGTFSRWNQRLPAVTGYPDEEVGELTPLDMVPETEHDRMETVLDEVRETGSASPEATLITADGERIPYDFRVAQLTGPDGSRIGVAAIGRDVSERKRRERQLRTFKRAVEDAGHAMFWMADDGTIDYVNPAFERQTGYKRDEAVGSMLETLWPGQSAALHDEMWDAIGTGDTWEAEFVNRRKDGRRYTVQMSVSPVHGGDEDKTTQYVGVASDITDRYRREQRLSVLQRVLRHDLRNNLNEVLLAAQIIDQQSDDSTVEKQVEAIRQSIDETLALAKKVRESQKLFENGEGDTTVVDIADRVRSQVSSLRTERTEVDFSLDLPRSQRVVASDLIDQALRNVIQNGIEHNDAATPRIEVTLGQRKAGDEVVLCVADNGPGVPQDEIDVLDMEQEDQLQHLSGFGLWFVNWVVTNSGGDLEFAKNEPRGSVVKVVFPNGDTPSG